MSSEIESGVSATVFEEARLGPVTLRNRLIKAATYEGMTPDGVPSPGLVDFHRALARGGVGLTTVAYCAVSPGGRTFGGQLWLQPDALGPLNRLVAAVHAEGGKAALQLSHAGFFSKLRGPAGEPPRGPSRAFNAYGVSSGLPFCGAMSEAQIEEVVDDFARAARVAVELGFDVLELHLGHGYLLSQFLSPATNRRRDRYGGSLENRLRFPLAVVEAVRHAVGRSVALLAKTNLADGFDGGLEIDEGVQVARALEATGALDALVLSGGFTSKAPFFLLRGGRPLAKMARAQPGLLDSIGMRVLGSLIIDEHPFEPRFFLPMAQRVRAAVDMPLVLLGGLVSRADLSAGREAGFEFLALGRALIADPDLPARMARGEMERTRCDACNECIVEMDLGGVRCVLPHR